MLVATVRGRTVARVRLSGAKLRTPVSPSLGRRLQGQTMVGVRRHGKYLLLDFDRGVTLLSHLGMSGHWLFFPEPPREDLPHVHARFEFEGRAVLWFQDTRRFGLLRLVKTDRAFADPSLATLGFDPVDSPPSGQDLRSLAYRSKVSVKAFLMDQRRLAGIGNIYASEILHRAGVDPRRRAGRLSPAEWEAVAREIPVVLKAAIEGMGTTFSTYRTLWNEPGSYGERLLVYDRADEPCRRCGARIRRIVQGQRSTFFCPGCQGRPGKGASPRRSGGGRGPLGRGSPRRTGGRLPTRPKATGRRPRPTAARGPDRP
jgi:formamidopyrimidine-DNA glycosylase